MSEAEKTNGSYVEFETTGDEYWAVDRFDRLRDDFGLVAGDLPQWQAMMSNQGRAWEIMRRFYRVASLTDPDDEVLREWTRAEIGKQMGIPKAQVDFEIEAAVKVWQLQSARSEVARQAVSVMEDDELERLTSFSNAEGIEKEVVDRLLEAFNFTDVRDEALRAMVAKRILSLKDYLSGPHTRTSAREIIRMEVTMHGLEKVLVTYQNQIERLVREDPERKSRGTEIDALSTKARELDGEIRKIGLDHAKKQKDIGADDIDMTTRKRIFVETAAYIMEQCRIYESDPANILVDGVFRAGEIDWLLEPLGERLPQYRPDIVVRVREALLPENLWNPEYVPSKIQVRVSQELRKIVESLRQAPVDGPALVEDDDEDDGGEGMMEQGGGLDVPQMEAGELLAPAVGAGYQRREEEVVMGLF